MILQCAPELLCYLRYMVCHVLVNAFSLCPLRLHPPTQALHLCRSQLQFDRLGELLVGALKKLNEHDFASWLDEQYLDGEWGCWFVTASGCPGLLPANNLVRLRSFFNSSTCPPLVHMPFLLRDRQSLRRWSRSNNRIKLCGLLDKKYSFDKLLMSRLPRMLAVLGRRSDEKLMLEFPYNLSEHIHKARHYHACCVYSCVRT
jgi:hypothetical protein